MVERHSDPLPLRMSLAILHAASRVVPRALRDKWMREWEAEVRHRARVLHRHAKPQWQEQVHLMKQSSGAFADAAFLRRQLIAHYFTAAFRHFRAHKVVSGVNVMCLAMGLTCFIVAWATTAYFAQADARQANASRLYIVIMSDASSPNAPVPVVSPRLLAEHLVADFPELDAVARATPPTEIPVSVDDRSLFADAVFADPPLLEMFELPMLHAAAREASTLLEAPSSAIVSRSFALQLFGTDRVVGRTVRLAGGESVTINGVVGAIPQPSQLSTAESAGALPFGLRFDILVSSDVEPARDSTRRWTSRGYYTYVMLPSDGSFAVDAFNDQLDAFAGRNVSVDDASDLTFRARPAAEVTQLWLDQLVGANATGISSTVVLMILGALVLLVACFNYANLATAQSLTHAREIAVRRMLGAERHQIFVQYLVEGFVLTLLALAVAVACMGATILVVRPAVFAAIAGVLLPMKQLWVFLAALTVGVTLCSTAYPALVLCRVPPAAAHRARAQDRARSFSSLLVGLQFAFSGFLLVAVFVTIAQSTALERAITNPGGDPIVVIVNSLREAALDRELLKTELAGQTGVSGVSSIDFIPWGTSFRFADLSPSEDPSAAQVNSSQEIVDPSFFDTMGIPIVAGRVFDPARAADTADVDAWLRGSGAADYNVVIDRAMVRRMGFGSPDNALGKVIYRPVSDSGSTPPQRLRVIGVVEDFVLQPLNFGAPMFYLMNPDAAVVPVVRIAKENVATALARIDETWARLAPDVPLRRRFANEQYEAAYGLIGVIDKVFATLGGLACVIATMGLMGISLHTMRRRTKEIAVRKVNGATARQVLLMLLADFSKPIVVANLAVWPIAWLVMRGYLSLFAVRSGLSWMPFAASLMIALGVAWVAIGAQIARAARASPTLALRRD